jgi:hypothetical protein
MRRAIFGALTGSVAITVVTSYALPKAGVTVRAIDEENRPLADVDVGITFEQSKYKPVVWGSADMMTKRGKSDSNGIFAAAACGGNYVGYGAGGNGYYESRGTIEFKTVKDGRYQPWNPIVILMLKKILNPVPMYARRLEIDIPILNESAGFDLIESDWVAPYGHGKSEDIRFKVTKQGSSFAEFAAELLITFGHKGSGIMLMPADIKGGSDLCSSHHAPTEGFAESLSMTQGNSKERGQYGLENQPRDYFFRARTLLDDRGAVVSALYGKIYGHIEFFPASHKTATLRFTYYLNPTPNDHNIEFDPDRNLFTNIDRLEKPTAP